MADLVLHINREVLHHGAEVALMMDLFAHRIDPDDHARTPMTTTAPPTIQIDVDAADPHALARFWAAAAALRAGGPPRPDRAAARRRRHHDDDTIEIDGRLAFDLAAACRHPEGTARACCSSTCRSRRR